MLRTSTLDLGPKIEEMEQRTAELLAKRHGVMVNSGSSALRLAIDLLHLEPGDEIITSVLTFSTDIAPMVQSGHRAGARRRRTRRPTRSTSTASRR